jgi:hypothetical protein
LTFKANTLSMKYFATYYLANTIHNVIADPANYLRTLEEHFGDAATAALFPPFPKHTALHRFVEEVWASLLSDEADDVAVDAVVNEPQYKLWVEEALTHHGSRFLPFRDWLQQEERSLESLNEDDIHDYYAFLNDEGPLDNLTLQVSREVFHIIFVNRGFLRAFNSFVAGYIEQAGDDGGNPKYFTRSGRLKRARVPVWAQKAVFHRDRGKCVFCRRDLTGVINHLSQKNFDHIGSVGVGRDKRRNEHPTHLRGLQRRQAGTPRRYLNRVRRVVLSARFTRASQFSLDGFARWL